MNVFQLPVALEVELEQSSSSCPEQYDAYIDHERVAYLRLRWGFFYVACPGVDGEIVYSANIGDVYTGAFTREDERRKHLEQAKSAILAWHARREEWFKCGAGQGRSIGR